MDLRKIKKLIELLEESNLQEMEIQEGEESIRLSRGGAMNAPMMMAPQMQAAPAVEAVAPTPAPAVAPADAMNMENYYQISSLSSNRCLFNCHYQHSCSGIVGLD